MCVMRALEDWMVIANKNLGLAIVFCLIQNVI